ncbi:MAG: SDR family oxidoreductase [Enterovibrio sp.]
MKKLALITGAEGGIGSTVTEKLVKLGFRVIAACYTGNTSVAEKAFAEKKFTKEQVRIIEMDVGNTQECASTLSKILSEEGTIDVLVNNAGITRDGQFKKMSAENWHAVINTNLNSVFNVTHPLFAAMCEKGNCRVINITSVNGLKGQFGQANYSAAKAGMIGFTKALALEGARFGVTVNAIAPGYTATPMVTAMRDDVLESIKNEIPMKRLAQPEEIAAAISFLASEEGAYITGETLSVNGGLYMR